MYCRTCSKEAKDDNTMCSKCDNHILMGRSYCPGCGKTTSYREVLCYICGHNLTIEPKSLSRLDISPQYRRIYRSTDENLIFGIMAGIAHKYRTNRTVLRLMAFLLTFLIGYYGIILVLIYFLAVFIPALPTKNIR